MICRFSDVSEHDMDMLFLEEFASSDAFLNIFVSTIGVDQAKVISIEASKTDINLGESDMTIVIEAENKRIGLLIEDKIDALAMPEQAARYTLRGEKGVEEGDYEEFYVFITAPRDYLVNNVEAQKYPNRIEYEQILKYFKNLNDRRAQFKTQQIEQAINKQKKGYQVQVDPLVTDFWRKYSDYQKIHYPDVLLLYNGEDKGSNAIWPRFNTRIDKLYMYHKTEQGYVDLTFDGCRDKMIKVERMLKYVEPNYQETGYSLHRTGKAAAIRLMTPCLDLHLPFESQVQEVEQSFKAVKRLSELVKKLSFGEVDSLLHS